jgi:soluble lytic murein transglycosylase
VIRIPFTLVAAAALGVAACGSGPPPPARDARTVRLERLTEGLELRRSDPLQARRALATAGSGAELERLRFHWWLENLEDDPSNRAADDDWREFLRQGPPADLADRARLEWSALLVAEGRNTEALTVLDGTTDGDAADELRLTILDGDRAAAIARRLAVAAPHRLRAVRPDLEGGTLATLSDAEWLQRARSWRRVSRPRTAAQELRSQRFSGDTERARRLELARAELERGRPSAALGLMPRLAQCTAEEALIRARVARDRGWSRWPGRRSSSAFVEGVAAARRARTVASSAAHRMMALELELECATEGERLDLALAAWNALAGGSWDSSRRSWLGRRLGVALARRDGWSPEVRHLAASLPQHARCFRWWAADGNPALLAPLADGASPDLYARWAVEDGHLAPSQTFWDPAPPVGSHPPPSVVRWLLDRDLPGTASVEWRRLATARGTSPAEALAAATFERERGRPDHAIRWLRRGFPALGGVDTLAAAENAVRAYLPLEFRDEVVAAAGEAGVDPWLLAGLARQESIFNPTARSPAGAVGLIQLLPGTARGHGIALGLGRSPDLTDPGPNLRIGARELRALLDEFGAVEPALAAYNAGPNRVRRWRRTFVDHREFTESIPIPETYDYVRRVRFLAEAYRRVWFNDVGSHHAHHRTPH